MTEQKIYDTLRAIRALYLSVPLEKMRVQYAFEDGIISPEEADELEDWVVQ